MGEHPTFMDKTALILKRDELGRVRTPLEKRRMAVEEFKRSGLSARKFAQLIGVRYNTFWNWLHGQGMTAKRRRKGAEPMPRLVEVCVDTGQTGSASLPSALQIGLPGGSHLLITDAAQVTLAAQLIKALA